MGEHCDARAPLSVGGFWHIQLWLHVRSSLIHHFTSLCSRKTRSSAARISTRLSLAQRADVSPQHGTVNAMSPFKTSLGAERGKGRHKCGTIDGVGEARTQRCLGVPPSQLRLRRFSARSTGAHADVQCRLRSDHHRKVKRVVPSDHLHSWVPQEKMFTRSEVTLRNQHQPTSNGQEKFFLTPPALKVVQLHERSCSALREC